MVNSACNFKRLPLLYVYFSSLLIQPMAGWKNEEVIVTAQLSLGIFCSIYQVFRCKPSNYQKVVCYLFQREPSHPSHLKIKENGSRAVRMRATNYAVNETLTVNFDVAVFAPSLCLPSASLCRVKLLPDTRHLNCMRFCGHSSLVIDVDSTSPSKVYKTDKLESPLHQVGREEKSEGGTLHSFSWKKSCVADTAVLTETRKSSVSAEWAFPKRTLICQFNEHVSSARRFRKHVVPYTRTHEGRGVREQTVTQNALLQQKSIPLNPVSLSYPLWP